MVFQQYFSNIVAISYCWGTVEFLENTTDLPQVTDRLSHNVVYIQCSTPRHERPRSKLVNLHCIYYW